MTSYKTHFLLLNNKSPKFYASIFATSCGKLPEMASDWSEAHVYSARA